MAKESVMDTLSNDQKLEISMYPRGVPGYTYTPHIDQEGNLTWTNNGNLPNPGVVNIAGPEGPQGLIEFRIVTALPAEGDVKVLYLLTRTDRETEESLYDEYIWVNGAYELLSEGKRTLSAQAQALIGYYYNTERLATLNAVKYLDGGEYALVVDEGTTGVPAAITEETNIVVKAYQTAEKESVYQELINFIDNKKYIRTIDKNGSVYSYGEWSLGTAGGIEIGEDQPTDSSTMVWIDTSEEGEIFDPNDYYTAIETDARLALKQNKLTSGTNIKTINGETLLGSGDISRHIITAYPNANVTHTAATRIIPFNSSTVAGTKLSLSNQQVSIGSGVTKVMVNGHLAIESLATVGDKTFAIRKNGTEIGRAVFEGKNISGLAKDISPFLIDVVAGDVLDLSCGGATGDVIKGGREHTFLTVEVIR